MAKIHCTGRNFLYTMCGRLKADIVHSVDEEIFEYIKSKRKCRKCRKCVGAYFYQLLQDNYAIKKAVGKSDN